MKKRSLIVLFILSTYSLSFAQNIDLDSLKTLLKKNIHDTIKLEVLHQLVNNSSQSEFEQFNIKLEALCLKLVLQKNNRIKYLVNSYLNHVYDAKSYVFREQGNLDSSFYYSKKSMKISEEINDTEGIIQGYQTLGILLSDKGEVLKSIDYFHKGLSIAEKTKDLSAIANFYSSISVAYFNLNNNREAIKYMTKSQKIQLKLNDKVAIGDNYNTLGSIYSDMRNIDSSLYYHKKAYQMFLSTHDTVMIITSLNNIGHTYYFNNQLDTALFYYKKAIDVRTNTSTYFSAYSTIYNNIGEIYLKKNNLTKAKLFSEEALKIEEEINRLPVLRNIYSTLEKIYFINKQYFKAYQMLSKYSSIKDTLLGIETQNASTKKFLNYEFEKKQFTDSVKVSEEKKLTTVQLKQEKTQRFALYGGLLLVIVFSAFIFNRFRITQQQKKIIELKNSETEIQKEIIEEKHKEITDSINYAERIQRSFLASEELLTENLKEHFVFFQPKDVVSGDFYWASKLNNGNFILATADSTGHGVPGAIMSILNITCIENAIKEGITEPAVILNHTRINIIERLKKDGSAEGGKDGMDCSLICLDFPNNKFSYASANNPIWVVRENHLIELSPDKMPVGKHDKDQISFTQHEFHLKKGDLIYTLTDGMPDQFGGLKGKKFMYKRLKEFLISISQLPMEIQKQKLNETLNSWKGNIEQVDDVCVIGIKI